MRVLRVVVGGIVAAVAWWIGVVVVFGPAQIILADPERQSAKFLAAFSEPPLPRIVEQPAAFFGGLLLVGLAQAATYAWLSPRLPGSIWRKGATFGVIAWALMVPWFELYLPWNVMHEPLPLVLLEAACWLVVLLGVGLATAQVVDRLGGGRHRAAA